MRAHNGGEGWVGDESYLMLWPVEELVQENRTLKAAEFVPGVVLFGSDGGGNLYGFGKSGGSEQFLKFPAVGMEPDLGESLGESWETFLNTLATPS
jgi:hypothetical protein